VRRKLPAKRAFRSPADDSRDDRRQKAATRRNPSRDDYDDSGESDRRRPARSGPEGRRAGDGGRTRRPDRSEDSDTEEAPRGGRFENSESGRLRGAGRPTVVCQRKAPPLADPGAIGLGRRMADRDAPDIPPKPPDWSFRLPLVPAPPDLAQRVAELKEVYALPKMLRALRRTNDG
jgi:hypothetical protein